MSVAARPSSDRRPPPVTSTSGTTVMWPSATAFATATTAVGRLAERLLLRLEPGGAGEPERLGGLRLGETDRLDARRPRPHR